MAHRQTTEIKLLKMRSENADELIRQMAMRIEWNESRANAFAFDVIQHLNHLGMDGLANELLDRYEASRDEAVMQRIERSEG